MKWLISLATAIVIVAALFLIVWLLSSVFSGPVATIIIIIGLVTLVTRSMFPR